MHLSLDAAPAVVSAPPFPNGSTEIARGIDRIAACDGAGAVRLPRLGVLARLDDSMSIACGNRVMAFSGVIGPIGGH